MKKALVVGAALGVASSADAATFTVTTNADSGAGSLRNAIATANATAGPDTITFDASLSGSTIALSTGEMLISDSVDIQGPGSANLTIDANETSRVFYIYHPNPAPIDVTISGLTIANAYSVVPGDPGASAGGAIRDVGETLSLDDVHVVNSVAGGDGGGIGFIGAESTSSYVPVSAVLSIQNSVISGNTSNVVDLAVPLDQGGCGGGVFAGGIYNVQLDHVTLQNNGARCDGGGLFGIYFQEGGVLSIQNSVVTGNTVGLGGEGGRGGGIALTNYGYSPNSSASIADTTIAGNTAAIAGGVYAYGMPDLTIARTTISGNTASDYAGGLGAVYSLVTLENSTIAENTASYGGGAYVVYGELHVNETTISGNTATGTDGPNLYVYGESTVEITNSILANGVGGADLVADPAALINVQYSLIEDPGTASYNDNGGNLTAVDPQLGPLQDNGGPTLTMKPAAASPVVNAGDPAFTPPPFADQRGFARVANGRIDMGAVELNPGTLQFSIAAQNVNENATPAVVTVTRTGGADGAISANIVVDGASTASGGGVDYTFPGAIVSFPDNDLTPAAVNVAITNDAIVDPAETIVLNLTAIGGTAIGPPAQHTITIIDDDIVAPASADLSIAKVRQPGPATQGANVTFTLTVTNSGPDAATNVTVSDTLPATLSYVSATPSTGSCSGTTTITCNLGTLNASSSATITIVAQMTGTGATTNTATVSSATADGDPGDNTSSVTFTIGPAAAVAGVPALDARMQIVLAAMLAAAALGLLKRS